MVLMEKIQLDGGIRKIHFQGRQVGDFLIKSIYV